MLPKFTEAMKQQQIAFDVYPYIAGPDDPAQRHAGARRKGADHLGRTRWPASPAATSGEVAQEMGCSTREAADRIQPAGAIYFMMDEKDVQSAMAHPGAMIGSDGIPFDASAPTPVGHLPARAGATTRAT